MVNGYAQTSQKIALSKLLGGRVLAPLRAAPPQHMSSAANKMPEPDAHIGSTKLWAGSRPQGVAASRPLNLAKGAIRVRSLYDLAETLQNKKKRWSG
jgi:hypothetical protein